MAEVARGGPATIGGILYQMLWSLLRVARIRISAYERDPEGTPAKATVILEPGGGDLEIRGTPRIVEQLKSRSSAGTWSLREIVESVLPDLYRAVDLQQADTRYRFVTEGGMGRWRQAQEFFASLSDRQCPESGVLDALDDSRPIPFLRHKTADGTSSRWDRKPFTARTLFATIVDELHEHPPAKDESIETTQRKVWHLLGHFEFVGGQSMARLRKEIDSLLLAVVDVREQVPEKRRAMLAALAERATAGSAIIDAEPFLRDCELSATPLTDWRAIRARAIAVLHEAFVGHRYDQNVDARSSLASTLAQGWAPDQSLLVLSGESGQGKSWLLYGLGAALSAGEDLIVLVPARGNADEDRNAVAAAVWQKICNHDELLSLERIAERKREILPRLGDPWLTVLLDAVQDMAEARQLAMFNWRKLGVRVAISCLPDVAAEIQRCAPDRACRVFPVRDFSVAELQDYLSNRLGEDWPDLPGDVRHTLRRPLLACIYCDACGADAEWRPTNEYLLYTRCWEQLSRGDLLRTPLARTQLAQLAFGVFRNEPYPWTGAQLQTAGMEDAHINALTRAGWLRVAVDGGNEIWHDRLLNWAAAEGAVEALQAKMVTCAQLVSALREARTTHFTRGSRFMGYVPLDLLWILSRSGRTDQEDLLAILEAIEEHGDLYGPLVRTLGTQIAPALAVRLQRAAQAGSDWSNYLADRIGECLAEFDAPEVAALAESFLLDPNPTVVHAAQRMLARQPLVLTLTRLWEIHCAIPQEPQYYRSYEASMAALRAAARLDTGWLQNRIRSAVPKQEPIADLGALCMGLHDNGATWRAVKSELFAKCGPEGEHILALNIWRHRDNEETPWLRERARSGQAGSRGCVFCALAALDPDAALEVMPDVGAWSVMLTRRQGFSVLLARRPEQTLSCIAGIVQRAEDPWQWAEAFSGFENAMNPAILDALVDALERELSEQVQLEPPQTKPSLHLRFARLAAISRLDLLERLESRRGSSFDDKLATWLLQRGPVRGSWVDHEAVDAMCVSQKIGGRGFAAVINQYLGADSHAGRMRGLDAAFKAPDQDTIALLAAITRCEELVQGFPFEQDRATKVLALLGEWHLVVESVVRWGSAVSADLAEHRYGQPPLDDDTVQPALEALQARDKRLPGAVIALGMAGRVEQVAMIQDLLEASPPESDVAVACMLAVEDLHDHSARTESLLVRQLTVKQHQYVAARALLRLGTDSALAHLAKALGEQYGDFIAVNLANRDETRVAAARAIWEHLRKPTRSGFVECQLDALGHLDDEESREFLRDRAFADEGALWFGGSKAAAIRGLAVFDKQSAILAAKKALENPEHHDRELYPGLLVELDQVVAVPFLLNLARAEESNAVFGAIARSISEAALYGAVEQGLSTDEKQARVAGVRFARFLPTSSADCDARLADLMLDQDDDISAEAHQSFWARDRQRQTEILVDAIKREPLGPRKWMLIDATLAVGDVGTKQDRNWPSWAVQMVEGLPYLGRRYIGEEIRHRRDHLRT